MKNLRRFAGIMIFLVVVFMMVALWKDKADGEMPLATNQIEYYFNEGWYIDSSTEEVTLPYIKKHQVLDTIVFKNTLPIEYEGSTMRFFLANASVCVFLDNKIIYQQELNDNGIEGKHVVKIPNTFQEGKVCIELTAFDQDKEIILKDVVIEKYDVVMIGLAGRDLVNILCCLLIEIIAIVMFVLALIRWYTGQQNRGELFLGLFGLGAGVYCFIGTDILSVFYNIQEIYVMQGYLMLMLPLFLTLYFERNLRAIYTRRFVVLLCFVICNTGIQMLLQIIGVQNLEGMVFLSSIMISIVCIIAIISIIQLNSRSRQYWILTISIFVLLLGELVNIILNLFLMNTYENIVRQYSMTIFSLIMAILHILQISKEYRFNAEEKVRVTKQQNILLAQAKEEADIAKQEALAANEAKGKFLAHMSHEIRTPINAVLGMDEMILRESKEQNIKEYAMDIYAAGQTLLSLINDILDFSKIDSGKMEIVPVVYDISSLIHDLVNMTSQRALDKNISLKVEVDHKIPSRLYGDDVRIRQVLTNILTNAVKYTHKGTVWLRVQSYNTEETTILRFEVEDTGIGIKKEDLPKLSAEFERIEEDKNRNIEGTGLGMSITIQLLALLGSKLQVESVYGQGSKFYFELEQKIVDNTPIGDFEAKVQQVAQNYNYNARFYAPDAKILVVDDNAVNRKVLRNLLKETQVQVTDADSGAECIRLVQENHYDLIFLDHMMPEMDGVETLHYIESLPECPCEDTPIVVLTANAVSGAKEKYLSEGFDDFLSKPIVPEKLENIIKKWLPETLLVMDTNKEERNLQTQTEKTELLLEELPLVEGLDWNYAWMHLPDMELLQYTIKEFYTQINSAADGLEKAYKNIADSNYLEQYRIQVHAMKSLAATVGIVPLSGMARVLEYAAKDGKIDVVTSITAIFLEEWRSYRQKLQGVFGIGTIKEKEVTDYSVIQALVEMVRISVQEMEIDQADQLIEQLRGYQYPEEIGQNIQKLAEAVTNLDPEESDRLAVLLAGQMTKYK